MIGKNQGTPLARQDTYIFIDVSNIRLACRKTLKAKVDFVRLMEYFRRKYPNLQEVRYYEGIAVENEKVSVSVLATPHVKDIKDNALSIRLENLYRTLGNRLVRYHLRNIGNLDCFSD